METFGEITTFQMNKKLILALDERWSQYFSSKNPVFTVSINQNKIMLIGPKIESYNGPITKENSAKEVSNIG